MAEMIQQNENGQWSIKASPNGKIFTLKLDDPQEGPESIMLLSDQLIELKKFLNSLKLED